MPKTIIISLLLLLAVSINAQEVFVYDSKSGAAIDGVLIHSATKSTETDKFGKADLSIFSKNDLLIFQHSSYLKHKTNLNKIWSQNYKIRLIEDPVSLNEIVISANRREQSKLEVPNKIVSIDLNDISFENPQTAADLLESKGGIFIQKSQLGGGSPMIRGFSANRLLLVVDGIRMNNAIYRNGNLHNAIALDPSSIKQTEVIFGPSSVIYGSDALGGVIHYQTLSPKLSTSKLYKQSRHVSARYSSANFEKTIHADLNFGTERWATLTSITFSDFDDLLMGTNGPDEYLRDSFVIPGSPDKIEENDNNRKQVETGYNQYNILQKFRFRPNNQWDINYAFHFSKSSDIPRYDRLIQTSGDQLKYAEWYYGPQEWKLHSFQAKHQAKSFLVDQLNLTLGWQEYKESRHSRKLNAETISTRKEDLDVLTLNFDLDKQIDVNNFIYYGIEGSYNLVHSSAENRNINTGSTEKTSTRYPDGSESSSLAAYLSYKLTLNKRFAFHAGSRYTFTWLQGIFDTRFFNFPEDDFSNRHSSLTGNIGLVYHPIPNWQLNTTISTGFRSPNIDDIAKVFDSTPGHLIIPNPDLKPEKATNFELGIIRSYANKAKLELNLFYTFLDDVMVRRDYTMNGQDSVLYEGEMSKVQALINADYAHIYGGSFSLEYLFNQKLSTRNSITLNLGEDNNGLPVRHVAPFFGSSHLVFDDGKTKLDLYLKYNGSISYQNLAESERDKAYLYAIDKNGNPYSPSWMTFNIKSSFLFYEKYYLNLGVENIFSERYRPYSSGIVAPGRNFIISLRTII